MKAYPHMNDKFEVGPGATAELVVWILPAPARGSGHSYKYRLALIQDDACVLR